MLVKIVMVQMVHMWWTNNIYNKVLG